ncbi:trichothecene 3-o-acetyltransferase [Fusarium pseudoanthophilum]|uniref:Trichothecene 3-o-acetyltransferase n=1 Tax=Fusarium pseudoanthophilum TaxID=48495 RepID=A0A8H5NX41_9HYPO|nr:trichothecene 3-o-acetyltransferase [Fusarium pseudoanthophilum]
MDNLLVDTEIVPLTNRVNLGEYHNLCLVFHDKTLSSSRVFISRVQNGLVRLSREFPWIAGQVQHDGHTDRGANKYKIIPFQVIPRFQIDSHPKSNIPRNDFGQKADEDWPMGWINENHVSIEPWADSKSSPVMELKLTLEPTASILTISMSSKVVDRTGLIMMVRTLVDACRGSIRNNNLSSSHALTTEKHTALFNDDKKSLIMQDRVPIRFVPDPSSTSQSSEAKSIDWALFTFDLQAVREVEGLVCGDNPSQGVVDTDKAFSAFVFRNICSARDDRLTSGWTARCFRTVDARNALGTRTKKDERQHLGALQHMTCNSYTNPSNVSMGRIARDLDKASSPSVLSRDVKHFLFNTGTAVGNAASSSAASSSAASSSAAFSSDVNFDPAQDVAIVSWADVECKSSAFQLSPVWKVRCIRIPYHQPASEGLVYFMPRSLKDEMTVALSLRETDLKRLLSLPGWIDRLKYDNH